MSVYQVEEYYITIDDEPRLKDHQEEIEELLQDENFEFQGEDKSVLIVDDFGSESDAGHIEEKIMEILGQ